jgi:hypothetical protein
VRVGDGAEDRRHQIVSVNAAEKDSMLQPGDEIVELNMLQVRHISHLSLLAMVVKTKVLLIGVLR